MKIFLISLAALLCGGLIANAEDPSPSAAGVKPDASEVPKGYEIGEDTISPNGRFAIRYPQRDEESNEGPTLPNILVRLKPYAVMTKLAGEPAWIGMRGEPKAKWNGNDVVAVWRAMKWGSEDLVVFEIANDKIKREEKLWPEVKRYFDRDFKTRFLKKYPKESDNYTFVEDDEQGTSFEFKGGTLLLNIFADNHPNLAGGPHWTARLQAVWNLETGKFDRVDFVPGKISVRPDPE